MEFKEATVYYMLGVMSGTSVDGIDLAYVKLKKDEKWNFEILLAETLPYTGNWQEKLREAIHCSREELARFDTLYTEYLAEKISNFIQKHEIKALDAIASHGHTILHEPEKGFTYQIGNKKALAKLTGQRVVCDFRVQDVQYGGQGAPLVPIGDQYLFAQYDACINIGGFANISFAKKGKRIAFDICPTNIVLNTYAGKLGLDCDLDGKIAATHTVDQNLLKSLNNLPFYAQNPPKSLGLEWVKAQVFPILEAGNKDHETVIATFTEHMAVQIAQVVNKLENKDARVFFTGGGAYNKYLLQRVNQLTTAQIEIPEAALVDFKEALIFAFMGALRLRNTPNILQSVTGANKDHCSGVIYTP